MTGEGGGGWMLERWSDEDAALFRLVASSVDSWNCGWAWHGHTREGLMVMIMTIEMRIIN